MSDWREDELSRQERRRELKHRQQELERQLGDVCLELRGLEEVPQVTQLVKDVTQQTVLYVDGGCSGNDQRDVLRRRMVAVVTDARGAVLSNAEYPGGSNNIAELMAVRDALVLAASMAIGSIVVRTDSRNNFAWVLGRKLGPKLNDRTAVERVRATIAELRTTVSLRLEWVPREQNLAGQYIEKTYGL